MRDAESRHEALVRSTVLSFVILMFPGLAGSQESVAECCVRGHGRCKSSRSPNLTRYG